MHVIRTSKKIVLICVSVVYMWSLTKQYSVFWVSLNSYKNVLKLFGWDRSFFIQAYTTDWGLYGTIYFSCHQIQSIRLTRTGSTKMSVLYSNSSAGWVPQQTIWNSADIFRYIFFHQNFLLTLMKRNDPVVLTHYKSVVISVNTRPQCTRSKVATWHLQKIQRAISRVISR